MEEEPVPDEGLSGESASSCTSLSPVAPGKTEGNQVVQEVNIILLEVVMDLKWILPFPSSWLLLEKPESTKGALKAVQNIHKLPSHTL